MDIQFKSFQQQLEAEFSRAGDQIMAVDQEMEKTMQELRKEKESISEKEGQGQEQSQGQSQAPTHGQGLGFGFGLGR